MSECGTRWGQDGTLIVAKVLPVCGQSDRSADMDSHEQTSVLSIRRRGIAATWFGTAFFVAFSLVAVVLADGGTGEGSIRTGLRLTARLAFLMFWPAYTAGALVDLFGPTFRRLQLRAREFGVAFAAVLLVHLTLVAWLCLIGAVPSIMTFAIFGVAAVFTYLLLFFSASRWQSRLGKRRWLALRIVGMNYVALAFAKDFLRNPLDPGTAHAIMYWPFLGLALVGPGLRFVTFVRNAIDSEKNAPRFSR